MSEIALNVGLTAALMSLVLWLSKTNPHLGGFILSLPLSSIIVLAFSKIQSGDAGNTVTLAKSLFLAIPLNLVFFVPFLFSLNFWTAYGVGMVLLVGSFGVHKWITSTWMS